MPPEKQQTFSRIKTLVNELEKETSTALSFFRITIRAARTNKNMGAEEACKLIGIGRVRLSQLENDSTNIPENILEKMIEAYEVPREALILGNEEEITGRKKKGGPTVKSEE